MKLLLELINTQIKQVTSKRPIKGHYLSGSGSMSAKSEKLGSGAFGTVERHENLPPGAVVKYGRIYNHNPIEDGYFMFLRAITKSDRMARNPYLPRIYSVKLMNNRQYTVVMEELFPFTQLSMTEISVMLDRMVGGLDRAIQSLPTDIQDKFKKSRLTLRGSNRAQNNQYDIAVTVLMQILGRMLVDRIPLDIVTDPKLKEAMMIMKRVYKQQGGSPDIRTDNVMVRRGPTGAQLVITDPLV
jgi:hypothetical protein